MNNQRQILSSQQLGGAIVGGVVTNKNFKPIKSLIIIIIAFWVLFVF